MRAHYISSMKRCWKIKPHSIKCSIYLSLLIIFNHTIHTQHSSRRVNIAFFVLPFPFFAPPFVFGNNSSITQFRIKFFYTISNAFIILIKYFMLIMNTSIFSLIHFARIYTFFCCLKLIQQLFLQLYIIY